MSTEPTIERVLDAMEIMERRFTVEHLLDERDEIDRKVDEKKREIKRLKTDGEAIACNVRKLRWEIRTQRTYEPAQLDMGYADTQLERPKEPLIDVFMHNYPAATTPATLLVDLSSALTVAEFNQLDVMGISKWRASGSDFTDTARWAQIENAHKSHKWRKLTPGMTLPDRFPMPVALARALASSKAKSPGPAAGIDGTSDEPDEETDPPPKKPAKKRRSVGKGTQYGD